MKIEYKESVKKCITILILLTLFVTGLNLCEKDNDMVYTTTEAEIIDFVSEKCYCCWGWVIKVGKDTIKSDELPESNLVGYEIDTPIKVIIEIGKKKTDCSSAAIYQYCNNFHLVSCTLYLAP